MMVGKGSDVSVKLFSQYPLSWFVVPVTVAATSGDISVQGPLRWFPLWVRLEQPTP